MTMVGGDMELPPDIELFRADQIEQSRRVRRY